MNFHLPEHAQHFGAVRYSYIVVAIDTVSAKIDLACRAQEMGIPIIASMGTGNKLDPSRFEVADLYETQVCPLCRVMRRELKKRSVKALRVVYSREEPLKPAPCGEEMEKRAGAGQHLLCAARRGPFARREVIRALCEI